jgi:hypothetical protein
VKAELRESTAREIPVLNLPGNDRGKRLVGVSKIVDTLCSAPEYAVVFFLLSSFGQREPFRRICLV